MKPKRIHSLDGGGIRGALALGYLEEIEKCLRRQHSNDDLKLCDYFDMIGGTSNGAIIAAGSASEIKEMYLELGNRFLKKTTSSNHFLEVLNMIIAPLKSTFISF